MASYLESVDDLFSVPLSSRVDLQSYSMKLLDHGIVYVAIRDDGRIAGLVGFYANDSEGGTAYLSLIVVSRDAQGRGVGTRLIAEAMSTAAKLGMQRMRLEVQRANTRAQAFYARLGFRLSDLLKDDGTLPASLYMEQQLGT
jgi:ribosomal protein S18 acetylase RimI-like enzyme